MVKQISKKRKVKYEGGETRASEPEAGGAEVVPETGVTLGDYFGVCDGDATRTDEREGCEGHGHAVVIVGGDRGRGFGRTTRTVPLEGAAVVLREDEAEAAELGLQGSQPIRLLDAQALQAVEAEGQVERGAGDDERLGHVGDQDAVAREALGLAMAWQPIEA